MVRWVTLTVVAVVVACGGSSKRERDARPDAGAGGSESGGTTSGGATSGGTASGGTTSGGATSGGATSGGATSGGTTSGSSSGGIAGEGGEPGTGGVGDCTEPNPAGCVDTGCPGTGTCVLTSGRCVPSGCVCDGGTWACTPDCNGGVCVDREACSTPDPSGCDSHEDCAPGERCLPPLDDACIPLGCVCNAFGDEWICREECGGGTCRVPDCPMGCEPQPSGFCGDEQVTWVCALGFDPDELADGGCTDPGTQVPRYCCPPTFHPECL